MIDVIQRVGRGVIAFDTERPSPVLAVKAISHIRSPAHSDSPIQMLGVELGQTTPRLLTYDEFDTKLLDDTGTEPYLLHRLAASRLFGNRDRLPELSDQPLVSPSKGSRAINEMFRSVADVLLTRYCIDQGIPIMRPQSKSRDHNQRGVAPFTSTTRRNVSLINALNVACHERNEPPLFPEDKIAVLTSTKTNRLAKERAAAPPSPMIQFIDSMPRVSPWEPDSILTITPTNVPDISTAISQSISSDRVTPELEEALQTGALTPHQAQQLLFNRSPGLQQLREELVVAMARDPGTIAEIFSMAKDHGMLDVEPVTTNTRGGTCTATVTAHIKQSNETVQPNDQPVEWAESNKRTIKETMSDPAARVAKNKARGKVLAEACGLGELFDQALAGQTEGYTGILHILGSLQHYADRELGTATVQSRQERIPHGDGHVYISTVTIKRRPTASSPSADTIIEFTTTGCLPQIADARATLGAYQQFIDARRNHAFSQPS